MEPNPSQNNQNNQNNSDNSQSTNPNPEHIQSTTAPTTTNIPTEHYNNPTSSTNPNSNIVFQDKPKKNHATLFGMIFLAILAIGGIGFGVWAMMDGNTKSEKKDEQISNLQSQLSEATQTESNCITISENSETITENNESTESNINTTDYIYVGEWGLKIKIPKELHRVSYEFKQHSNEQVEGTTIVVAGTVSDDLPDFANPYKNASLMGAVSKTLKTAYDKYDFPDEIKECGYASLVFSEGDYNYCYSGPQAVFSTDKSEQSLEVESVNLIRQMLQNKDNYSKI